MAGYANAPRESRPVRQPSGQGLPKDDRLGKPSEFTYVYENGRKCVGRFMVLWHTASPVSRLRLGVVAGRKTGNSVERSRAKRRLREMFRRNRDLISKTVDLVLVARRPLVKAPWDECLKEYHRLIAKAGLQK